MYFNKPQNCSQCFTVISILVRESCFERAWSTLSATRPIPESMRQQGKLGTHFEWRREGKSRTKERRPGITIETIKTLKQKPSLHHSINRYK